MVVVLPFVPWLEVDREDDDVPVVPSGFVAVALAVASKSILPSKPD